MVNLIAELVQDWRRLDERIAAVSAEIETLAQQDGGCQRVMTVPGVGPIISSAVVAAIGNGAAFARGRDFSAWLGLVPKQMSTGDRTILGPHLQARQRLLANTLHASSPGHSVAVGELAEARLRTLGQGCNQHDSHRLQRRLRSSKAWSRR
jgi:transposase